LQELRLKILRVFGVVAVLYVAYGAALFLLQDPLVFPGASLPVPKNLPRVAGTRLIPLPFEGGQSVAFYLPSIGQKPSGKTGAMIIAHGNGEIADNLVEAFNGWRSMGIALMVVEYPGYGRAPGTPGDESIRKAMVAAFDWLAEQPEIESTRIAAHGISLGGGAVGLLMRERPLAGAMLHATFTTLRAFPPRYGLPGFLLRNEMNMLEAVEQTKILVFVIHGKHDSIIAPEHGIALAKAAKMNDFSLWDCGHGCFEGNGKPLFDATQSFLKRVGVVQ
jgi:uncharacterized protein